MSNLTWTRKRPGVYECAAGMVYRQSSRNLRYWVSKTESWMRAYVTLREAKAAVEAHAREVARRG